MCFNISFCFPINHNFRPDDVLCRLSDTFPVRPTSSNWSFITQQLIYRRGASNKTWWQNPGEICCKFYSNTTFIEMVQPLRGRSVASATLHTPYMGIAAATDASDPDGGLQVKVQFEELSWGASHLSMTHFSSVLSGSAWTGCWLTTSCPAFRELYKPWTIGASIVHIYTCIVYRASLAAGRVARVGGVQGYYLTDYSVSWLLLGEILSESALH